MKVDSLQTEYNQGFCKISSYTVQFSSIVSANTTLDVPNVVDLEEVKKLETWDGSWTQLSTIKWIKVFADDQFRNAQFPSKGLK